MKLLIRHISAYTGSDLLLGIFENQEKAMEQKTVYIEKIKNNDRWKNQTHHTVDLEKDIKTKNIEFDGVLDESIDEVFVVIAYAEGFGQILSDFKIITADESRANFLATELEEKEDGFFPSYFEVEKYIYNRLEFYSEDINPL